MHRSWPVGRTYAMTVWRVARVGLLVYAHMRDRITVRSLELLRTFLTLSRYGFTGIQRRTERALKLASQHTPSPPTSPDLARAVLVHCIERTSRERIQLSR